MRNKEAVAKELETAGIGPQPLECWRRKVALFAENLGDNEHVIGGVRGVFRQRWGRLVATETRLLFVEKVGFFGSIVESFSYSRLSAVECTKRWTTGEITIISGSSSEQISLIDKRTLTSFLDLVQSKVGAFHYAPVQPPPAPPRLPDTGGSVVDRITQLERLANLRKIGALTEDEFQIQKVRALGG
jgi:Bacterial PH domain